MFNRFVTVLTLTGLVSLGSWGTMITPEAGALQHSSFQSRRWERPRPRFRPSRPQRRLRTYRRHPRLYTTHSRRLSFRVGARRLYAASYVGGIARDSNCPMGNIQLERLASPKLASEQTNKPNSLPADRTVSARPTFFAVLPQLPAGTAEITVQSLVGDQPDQEIFMGEFEITGQAGIVGVQLPETSPELEVGRSYRWQIAVRCDPENDENQWVVMEGGIERVLENISDSRDVAEAYAEQGIWQDVLEMMVMLRFENPEDGAIAQQWTDLMTSARLPQFAKTPVIQIEVPEQI